MTTTMRGRLVSWLRSWAGAPDAAAGNLGEPFQGVSCSTLAVKTNIGFAGASTSWIVPIKGYNT